MKMLSIPNHSVFWASIAVIWALFVTGCEPGSNEYMGPTGTVSGKVTLNGKAVPEGCRLAFVSDAGFSASGTVGADGSYQLSVLKSGGSSPKIPVATYRVSVGPPSSGEMSEAEYEAMMDSSASGGAEAASTKSVIPDKYQAAATSELTFDVTEGANTIDIDLK